jgi:transcriptional regulator GlxA family with amidase domain
MHELERIKVIEAVCEHRLTMVRAAERLGLCERQISRRFAAMPRAVRLG